MIQTMAPRYTDWPGFASAKDADGEFELLNRNPQKVLLETLKDNIKLFEIHQRIFALDMTNETLVFDVSWELEAMVLDGVVKTTVRQETLWRDSTADNVVRSLPTSVFWDKVVKKADVVVTSPDQTADGRRFWESQIATAFKKGWNVSHWNKNTGMVMTIPDIKTFKKEKMGFWGNEASFENSRIILWETK